MFGVSDRVPECLRYDPHEDRDYQGTEVGADPTEGKAKVHALAKERVHPPPHTSMEVVLQGLEELPDLEEGGGGGGRESHTHTFMHTHTPSR